MGKKYTGNGNGKNGNGNGQRCLMGIVYVNTPREMAIASGVLMNNHAGSAGRYDQQGKYGVRFTYSSNIKDPIMSGLIAAIPNCDVRLDIRKE